MKLRRQLITGAHLAARHGVDADTVAKWQAEGLPVARYSLVRRRALFDPETALWWLVAAETLGAQRMRDLREFSVKNGAL